VTQPPEPASTTPGEPSPGAPSKEERFTAQLVWGIDVFFQLLGPYLMWRLQAWDSAFVAHHAKACINHGLTVMALVAVDCLVVGALCGVYLVAPEPETEVGITLYKLTFDVTCVVVGVVLAALLLATFVIHVVALFKAGRGAWYVPPLCWRFVK